MADENEPTQDMMMQSLAGHIAAQRFLLENLWTLLISTDDVPMQTLKKSAKKSYEQFSEYISSASEAGDIRRQEIAEHGLHHLESFWLSIEDRMRRGSAG